MSIGPITFSNADISVVLFIILSVFTFSQKRHIANFKGESKDFKTFLSIFDLCGTLLSLIWLVLYGLHTHWWCAIIAIIAYLISGALLQTLVSKIIPELFLSLAGFVFIPILLFFMSYLV